ncbi:hypothetical protein EYF80_010560 [Liparis tanakae]|uniref:Uncharacterized protein n=1 Tax=Liparis tanakae TaxID=230148 RepID=A0A4Z2IN81_9TELE|nr:hypothetical protein EYF80_010560 [Liparis tanakae]
MHPCVINRTTHNPSSHQRGAGGRAGSLTSSCNYRGEGSSCTGCEARAPSPLGSGRWWAGQIRPALLISQPLIDIRQLSTGGASTHQSGVLEQRIAAA